MFEEAGYEIVEMTADEAFESVLKRPGLFGLCRAEERDSALARIARVEALHEPVDIEPSETICGHCSYRLPNGRYFGKVIEWPCDTVRALTEGEPGE